MALRRLKTRDGAPHGQSPPAGPPPEYPMGRRDPLGFTTLRDRMITLRFQSVLATGQLSGKDTIMVPSWRRMGYLPLRGWTFHPRVWSPGKRWIFEFASADPADPSPDRRRKPECVCRSAAPIGTGGLWNRLKPHARSGIFPDPDTVHRKWGTQWTRQRKTRSRNKRTPERNCQFHCLRTSAETTQPALRAQSRF